MGPELRDSPVQHLLVNQPNHPCKRRFGNVVAWLLVARISPSHENLDSSKIGESDASYILAITTDEKEKVLRPGFGGFQ